MQKLINLLKFIKPCITSLAESYFSNICCNEISESWQLNQAYQRLFGENGISERNVVKFRSYSPYKKKNKIAGAKKDSFFPQCCIYCVTV